MIYEAILFDLDGTLLPMDYNKFMKGYLGLLSKKMVSYGFEPEKMVAGLWHGVEAMVKNNGSVTNCDAFWKDFSNVLGAWVYDYIEIFDGFYSEEFNSASEFTSPTPDARRAVALARSKAQKVVLATNPMFPTPAVETRLKWAGLSLNDFDLATDYFNSSYCKPNPNYYKEIVEKLNVNPEKCLMIGNNTTEDIFASAQLGMKSFLLTPCLICDGEMPDCPQGDFNDLFRFLNESERNTI